MAVSPRGCHLMKDVVRLGNTLPALWRRGKKKIFCGDYCVATS
jgi:hypothetical protein